MEEAEIYKKSLQNTVIVPGDQHDKMAAEIEELKSLERQYAHTLGRLAQLCNAVCPWIIGDGRSVVPLEVFLAADEIMDYVDSVKP